MWRRVAPVLLRHGLARRDVGGLCGGSGSALERSEVISCPYIIKRSMISGTHYIIKTMISGTHYIMVFAYIPYDIMDFGRYQGYQEAWSTMISCYDIIGFYDIIYDIMVLEDISGVPRSPELHVSCT